MAYADWRPLVRVVAAFPAMIGVVLYLAAWIQRRPSESIHSVFTSTFITTVIGVLWLIEGPQSLARLGLAPYSLPLRRLIELGAWRAALGTFLLPLPIALIMYFLLLMWMPARTKVSLSLAVSGVFLVSDTVTAELPFVLNGPGAEIPLTVWSLSVTILGWACIARPYTRDWAHQCRTCGYDLRGINADTCPECGAQIPQWMLDELRGVTVQECEPADSPDPAPKSPPLPTLPPSTPPLPSPSTTPAHPLRQASSP
jgi:hypothetical protein